jgi:hypothetical protein
MGSRIAAFFKTRGGAALLALAWALFYWWPAFRHPLGLGSDDWGYFHHMWEVGWIAWSRFREIALWDPFQCGGVPLFGDPQAQIYGPWFLLSFVIGTTLALKVGIVLHVAVSLLTTYRYAADHQGLSRPASMLAAVVFSSSGFFAWHIAQGHVPFLPFLLLPSLLLLYHRALVSRPAIAWLALLLAYILFEGGVYPLPFGLLLLGFEASAQALRTRRPLASFLPLVAALAGFALIAGVRWIPSMVELSRHPRPTTEPESLSIIDLVDMLTARTHEWAVPGHRWKWNEFGSYVGSGVALAALIGYHRAFVRRRPHAALGFLLFVLLACGNLGYLAPSELIHRLPVFDSLRVPSRFIVVAILFLALLAGMTLDEVSGLLRRWTGSAKFANVVGCALALACAADLWVVGRPLVDTWQVVVLPPIQGDPFHQAGTASFKSDFPLTPRLGRGSLGCYTVLDYAPAAALREGRVPQAEVVFGDGVIHSARTTVNKVLLDVSGSTPSTLVINQNYSADFISNIGVVHEDAGRLAVDVPAGTQHVRLVYRPATLRIGLATTILGLLLTLGYLIRSRQLSRRRPDTQTS